MENMLKLLKALSDGARLRILMLLSSRELCVCQLMAVLCISQPLVSKNLNIMKNAGLIRSRRDGKLMFYSINRALERNGAALVKSVIKGFKSSPEAAMDLEALSECTEFQKKTGRCDMETLKKFLKERGCR